MNIKSDVLFRSLADPTRLRCLLLLAQEGELCVCELIHALKLAQPKVSHHLALLREAGLVRGRRQGLWIHYRLHPELPLWVRQVVRATVKGVAEEAPFAHDRQRLETMSNRPAASRCA